MKQFKITFSVTFILYVFLQVEVVNACTAFCLVNNDHYVLVGKNLDWPVGDGFILINPRGISKTALTISGEKPARWVSKYGSITFNQFGKELPLGGMNETGLVVEELSYSPSVYPEVDSLFSVNELQWIQYQLDNYSSVDEVIKNLEKINISRMLFGLHYFVCDRFGQAAIIEFINGRILVYSGKKLPVPVLANNSYENSIRYLKLRKKSNSKKIPANSTESPERFYKTVIMLQKYSTYQNSSPVEYALKILQNVKQQDTQWSILYNPSSLTIKYSTLWNPVICDIQLKNIDFSANKSKYFPLSNKKNNRVIIGEDFYDDSPENQTMLIEEVLNKYIQFKVINKKSAGMLGKKVIKYQRNVNFKGA